MTADLVEHGAQLVDEPLAQQPVQRAERLVQQQHSGLGGERPCQRDALRLAARQRGHVAALEARQPDQLKHFNHSPAPFCEGHSGHAQPERHVALDIEVREQHFVLEHQADAALVGALAGQVAPVELNLAGVERLQPRGGPQQRRLAAARRSEQHHHLAVADGEIHPVSAP